MTSVQDSVIFGNILSTQPSAAIWSDTTRTSYYLRFEECLAQAQAQLGIIPERAATEIMKHCRIEEIDWDELRKQTELIGYPVLGVVKQLVGKVNLIEPGLGEWCHWGATTQDVTDTATVLQLRDTLDLVTATLDRITTSLKGLCEKYRSTPMAARSNLQQAVPMTFGFKLARLLATFQRHSERIASLRPRLLVVQFSGAAGTLATLDASLALQCQSKLALLLDLETPIIAWHTERDSIAETGAALALLTSTCAKFALDLKLMMQSEVGEASEPYVQHRGSSSTMPQKRNPIGCAYITAAAASVRQLSTSLLEACVADHERSTGPWEIEWIALPQICTLAHSCLCHTAGLLEGLEVDEGAMQRNLGLSKGAIVSEAVMMGLGEKLGRQCAHDLVYDICRQATLKGVELVELLWENDEVKEAIEREKLEELCKPENYLGLSEVMVDRVLKAVKSAEVTGTAQIIH